ncbi:MAG: hypothetical protein WBC89_06505 [Dehalococcoidia bacterium]|jgi:hypothetical protein
MTQPRQRHIPLNIDERQELDRRKRDYESRTGDVGDWGKFLGTVSLAGLAALGVYAMAQAIKRAPTVWQVDCSSCGVGFPIQVPNPPPWRLAWVKCPNCGAELVIDFAKSALVVSNEHEADSDSVRIAFCHVCQQPIKATFSRVNPQGVEYLECERCGRVPGIRSWE